MPAVYSIDLIAKRDKKIKMDRSIVKGWNVHYQTLQEVEDEAYAKRQKQREEQAKELDEAYREQEEAVERQDDGQQEETKEQLEKAYNAKTGSYSGKYGEKAVEDEATKKQIHAILTEKSDVFHSALSALQEEQNMKQ